VERLAGSRVFLATLMVAFVLFGVWMLVAGDSIADRLYGAASVLFFGLGGIVWASVAWRKPDPVRTGQLRLPDGRSARGLVVPVTTPFGRGRSMIGLTPAGVAYRYPLTSASVAWDDIAGVRRGELSGQPFLELVVREGAHVQRGAGRTMQALEQSIVGEGLWIQLRHLPLQPDEMTQLVHHFLVEHPEDRPRLGTDEATDVLRRVLHSSR
jgi:hypothetical protein